MFEVKCSHRCDLRGIGNASFYVYRRNNDIAQFFYVSNSWLGPDNSF